MSPGRRLNGLGVSPGCAVGPAHVIQWGLPDVPERVVSPDDIDGEIGRLRSAVNTVKEHLQNLAERARDRAGPEEAKIFDAQIMMLEDADFLAGVERLIRENRISAEQAFEYKTLEMRALWAQSESALLKQRRADLYGIGVRVIQELMGRSLEGLLRSHSGPPVIVVTRELTPDLTVEFDQSTVAGFVSAEGTRTSHAAILAHGLGIPCVLGVLSGLDTIESGRTVILDGSRGTLLLDPTPNEVTEALEFEERRRAFLRDLEGIARGPTATLDGATVVLRANLDLPDELDAALSHGAEGVGLLRTEFLLLGRTELPTEDEQFGYFSKVAAQFPHHPVVIRSYDLGGDKFPAPFRPPREPNPFLGWRAIRVCLDQPDMFRTQIRAVMRAGAHGDVQLMLPLITQLEELERSREFVEEAADQLAAEGLPHNPELPVGVMIETPAAALIADELARKSDFLSVGTNDLTQYTLAVDRGNAGIADRFTPFHPAVVRTLNRIAQVGFARNQLVSVCGEMGSDPLAALLLLSLGYRVFSVAPPKLSLVRWLLRQVDIRQLGHVAAAVVEAPTTQDVIDVLTEAMTRVVDLDLLTAGQLPEASGQTSFKL
jgi:phosphoenolpyruvate-protein phosphotransferase (PTS system enzyme I)